jgi:hypothetical protein
MAAIGNEIIVDVAQLSRADGEFVAARPTRIMRGGASVMVAVGEPLPEVWEQPTHRQRSLLRNRDVLFRFSTRAVNTRGAEIGRRILGASSKATLEVLARELGLAASGAKDELVAAITQAAGWEG